MKIAIVGGGVEGQAASGYWGRLGDVEVLNVKDGPDYLSRLAEFDLVVRSPGVRPDLLTDASAVTSVTDEFLRIAPHSFGVTGTKGKGTTASYIAHVLETCGRPTAVAGNIGVAAVDVLDQVSDGEIPVLELSSFQLIDLRRSPRVAVCLPVTSDHLDWHTDADEYRQAKQSIFAYQSAVDIAVYAAADPVAAGLVERSAATTRLSFDIASDEADARVDGGWVTFRGRRVVEIDHLGLQGPHNVQNALAALAATWFEVGGDVAGIGQGLATFKGLPHRLAPLRTVAGVLYVDDSYSTMPEATIAALQAWSIPKVLIAGGSSKGADFAPLADQISGTNCRHAVLIGDERETIARHLEEAGFHAFTVLDDGLDHALLVAQQAARSGDAVIYSPGSASFDMFKNAADRGQQFVQLVQQL